MYNDMKDFIIPELEVLEFDDDVIVASQCAGDTPCTGNCRLGNICTQD